MTNLILRNSLAKRKWWMLNYKLEQTYLLPENWNDFDFVQLKKVVEIIMSSKTITEGKLQLLKHWIDGNDFQFKKFQKQSQFEKMTPEDKYSLISQTEFIFQNNALTKQNLPSSGRLPFRYYGPSSEIKNSVISEFAFAEIFFKAFKESNEIIWLDKLIATIYRPKKWWAYLIPNPSFFTKDVRQKFNDISLERRAKKIAEWAILDKHCILFFYEGCRNKLIELHPNVFSDDNKKKSESSKYGWATVIHDLSGGKFGTFDETAYAKTFDVLRELEIGAIKANDMEEEFEKQKRKNK